MQHLEELAMNDEPKNPGVYSQEKVHGKLRRWNRYRGNWAVDKVQLGPLANANPRPLEAFLYYLRADHETTIALVLLQLFVLKE